MRSLSAELSEAAFELLDAARPVDPFLERVTRLVGCRVALCVELPSPERCIVLGAAGLAAASRERLASLPPSRLALPDGACPELHGAKLVRWIFRLDERWHRPRRARRCLALWFDRRPPRGLHRALRGVSDRLSTALEHRARCLDHVTGHEPPSGVPEPPADGARARARLSPTRRFAAGIAHEISGPLACVLTNVQLALARLRVAPADPTIREFLADALEATEHARSVVQDLRTFSGAAEPEGAARADVASAVRTAEMMARHELLSRARLVVRILDAPPVAMSPHRLGEVLLNLLVNAAHAITAGHAAENEVRLEARPAENDRVLIEVADTGSGIAPDHLPRIFEPQFTTKRAGLGAGLGLSIVRSVVTSAGGEIGVTSVVGEGTTFRLLLPSADRAPTTGADSPPGRPAG